MSLLITRGILLLLFIAILILQRALSKAKTKTLGLILPLMSFSLSIYILYSIGWIEPVYTIGTMMVLMLIIGTFNIPTIVLMIIYGVVRRKK